MNTSLLTDYEMIPNVVTLEFSYNHLENITYLLKPLVDIRVRNNAQTLYRSVCDILAKA